MAYGTIKVDNIVFTNAGSDQTITVSGLVASTSGNLTVTGTISGNTIQGQTVSGVTVTGTTANFTSGNFTTITGGTVTLTSGVIASGTAANPSLSILGDANTGLYSPGADQLAISTGGSGRLFVNSNGDINVGHSSSAYSSAGRGLISVNGSSSSIIDLQTALTSRFRIFCNGTNTEFFNTEATGDITFGTNSLERLRITAAGLVGVGTSSPGGQLTVYSAGNQVRVESPAASNADILFRENGVTNWAAGYVPFISAFRFSNGSSDVLTLTNTGRVGVGTTNPGSILTVSDPGTGLAFTNAASGNYNIGLLGGTGSAEAYVFNRANSPLIFGTNNQERLRITAAGLVGIGTSAPADALHLASGNFRLTNGAAFTTANSTIRSISSYAGSANQFETTRISAITGAFVNRGEIAFSTGDDTNTCVERLRIDYLGRLGVGTASPATTLHTVGTVRISRSDDAAQYLNLYASAGEGFIDAVNSNSGTNQPIIFRSGNNSATTERARIDSSGRLGIGTSSPAAKVDVWPASTDAAFRGNSGVSVQVPAFEFSGYNTNTTNGGLDIRTNLNGTFTDRVRITNDGLVGIGTTSPRQALTFGSLTSSSTATPDCIDLGATYTSTSASTNLKFKLYVDSSGNTYGFTVNGSSHLEYYAGTVSSPGNHVFLTGGSERARIDSSGRLLVGTSTPRSNFFNGSDTAGLQVESTNYGLASISLTGDGTAGNLFINRSGSSALGSNVLVANNAALGGVAWQGTDGDQFVVAADISAFVDGAPGANDMPGRLVFSTTAAGASSPTERMRIENNGKIAFGGQGVPYPGATCDTYSNATNNFAHVFRQDNAAGFGIGIAVDSPDLAYFYPNKDLSGAPVGGISQNGSATSFNTSSDYRLKENISPLPDAIVRLSALKPSRFNFISHPDRTVDGFIAHEVQAIVPEAINGEKDAVDDNGTPVYQGIDQSKLVPLLTAALQEAVAKIESLEARLTAAGI